MSYWIAGGTVVGGIGSALIGSSSAEDANEAAIRAQAEENRKQREWDERIRNEDIERAFGGAGGLERRQRDYLNFIRNVTPAGELGAAALDFRDPAVWEAMRGSVGDVYDGDFYNEELAKVNAVNAALENAGLAEFDAIDEARREEAGNVKARNVMRGFSGNSSALSGALARARMRSGRDASRALSESRVLQKQGLLDLTRSDQARQLASLGLAGNLEAANAQSLMRPDQLEQTRFDMTDPRRYFETDAGGGRTPYAAIDYLNNQVPTTGMAVGEALKGAIPAVTGIAKDYFSKPKTNAYSFTPAPTADIGNYGFDTGFASPNASGSYFDF